MVAREHAGDLNSSSHSATAAAPLVLSILREEHNRIEMNLPKKKLGVYGILNYSNDINLSCSEPLYH